MLPINSGTYSSQYPDHTYGTLQKAMHQQKNSRNYLLTIDKVSTWNQGVIAYSCLLYTSDAADDLLCVDLGGRRTIKKKNNNK